jgi:hypothetical protein
MNRQEVLNWMQDNQIKNYKKVGDIISRYYSSPKDVLEKATSDSNPETEGQEAV